MLGDDDKVLGASIDKEIDPVVGVPTSTRPESATARSRSGKDVPFCSEIGNEIVVYNIRTVRLEVMFPDS